jgi:uncharacterized membrane protein
MHRIPSRDWIGGAILVIVGGFFLARNLAPGVEVIIPLLVGLALLGLFLGGVAAAARRTGRAAPGAAAALAVYGAHSAIDWDWELPALTLVAVVLAGAVLAAAERPAQLAQQRPLAR